MADLRDYEDWHRAYDDPTSELSHRLREVQRLVGEALDRTAGPVRVLSACAGDGRDVLTVLADRADRDRVDVTLVELNDNLADAARARAVAAAPARVDVRALDAGTTDAYIGAVPADVVLLVGIFGNITPEDIERTVHAAPALCAPGATVVWSRGQVDTELNESIRAWFAAAGFTELDLVRLDGDRTRVLGVERYDGPAVPLVPGRPLFTFVR